MPPGAGGGTPHPPSLQKMTFVFFFFPFFLQLLGFCARSAENFFSPHPCQQEAGAHISETQRLGVSVGARCHAPMLEGQNCRTLRFCDFCVAQCKPQTNETIGGVVFFWCGRCRPRSPTCARITCAMWAGCGATKPQRQAWALAAAMRVFCNPPVGFSFRGTLP